MEPWFGGFLINFFATQEDLWSQWCHKQPYVFQVCQTQQQSVNCEASLSSAPREEAEIVGGGALGQIPPELCKGSWVLHLSWKPSVFVREIVLDTCRAVGCDERRSCSAKAFAQLLLDKAWQVRFWLHLSARNELVALICHHCCRLMGFLLRVTAFLLTASCCQIPFTSKLWGESCFFSF